MNQREVIELIREAKSLPQLAATLKASGVDPAFHDWAVRYFLDVRARQRGIPLKGTFELTPLCNLDCKMCYVHLNAEQLRGQKLLPAEDWERIMDEAIQAGMMYASLTGGECLTSPDFDRLYLYLHSRGVQVSVLTNGILLDEKRISFFKQHPPMSIQITLYGADEESYERVTGKRMFQRVVENLRRADEEKLPLVLSLTPNEYLGREDEKLVRFAASLGIPFHINSSLMTPRSNTERAEGFHDLEPEDYIRLFKLEIQLKGYPQEPECELDLPKPGGSADEAPRGLRCGGGRSGFAIMWNGRMAPCNGLSDMSVEPLKIGFADAWKTVNQYAENYPLPRECEDCPYQAAAHTCVAGHCAAEEGHADMQQCKWCKAMVQAGFARLK